MKLLGYYLVKPSKERRDFLPPGGEEIYSVSGCICEQFPACSSFWGGEEDKKELMSRLGIDKKRFDELSVLYTENINVPGFHFISPDAARVFLDAFNRAGYGLKMLSVHMDEADYEAFISILEECVSPPPKWIASHDDESGVPIGKDIIGFDSYPSHSWVCNSLHHDEYPTRPRFNRFGLLDNDWEEVREFARMCQGRGEPIVWMPCVIKEHPPH